jgi:ATP/maltotriose-dependent transcriptional regulator MalT/DNA-binding SARP family transcriptional activator
VPYPSKVTLPVRRPAIVRRQRLIDALSQAVERKITLVSAPAGYGKTTLLMDFAQSWTDPVCWYALDERDRDLDAFLRYFLASGRQQFPDFGAELTQALEQGDPIAPEDAVDLLVAATALQEQPHVIIFDDFHFLDEAPLELKETLEGWLYRLPPSCHVILSGRTQAQLAMLPLMSVRQEVDAITAANFSFTCEEVMHLFRDVLAKEITPDDAQHLADITEGWAGALVLLADRVHASRTSISLEHLRRSDALFQYITLEQFKPLPEDVKAFLTGSAIPRTIEIGMINELLGISDTEEQLSFLERRNLFVLRDEKAAPNYRYHRLFRAFLISHLRTQDHERFQELNLKAAAMKEQAEEWEEAVYHYIQASAWDRIIQVTERVGWRMFEEGRWDTLAEWLDAIPAEELTAQPKLLLWKARIFHSLNQIDNALALVGPVVDSLESSEDWLPLAQALVVKGMCLGIKGAHNEAKEALTKATTILREHDGPTSILTEARMELGRTYNLCGEFEHAQAELKAVLDIYESAGDVYNVAHVSDQLAIVVALLGRIADAAVHFQRAQQCWTKLHNDERLLLTTNNLGFLYYLQGDFDQAETILRKGLEKAEGLANARPEMYLRQNLADVKRDKGEWTVAIEMYLSSLEMAQTMDEALISCYISDGLANTYRLMGDMNTCEAWAQRAAAIADDRAGLLELGISATTLGLIQRERGQLKDAVSSLERAVSLLKESEAKRELARANFHLAGVYFSLKRKSLALERLNQAAELVKGLGYDHFLTVEARRNPLLVQYAAANKLAGGYFEGLLKVMKGSRPTASGAAVEEAEPGDETETGALAYGFGNLRVEIAGREITDLEWRSEKGKEMFFFFLCNRRPLRKEEIVAALWPDLPDDKTTSAFHSNMYRLRKALYAECIAKESGRYILDPQQSFAFDVQQFQQALQKADLLPKGSPETLALMEKALSLYKGQFAADFYSEWAETLRWQLEEQYTSLLAALATAYSEAKEYMRSAEICQRIIDMDEFNEAAWYRLMSNYIQSNQMEAARYSYNRYVQILTADDMDAEDIPDFEDICRELATAKRP